MNEIMRPLVVAAFLLGAVVPALSQQATSAARVVAIGDIHGAFDEFTAILKRAGLVNDRLAWSGGGATLVQTGDYTDRGTDVRKVLDLLMRLEREAKSSGGQVITLLGNHEVMNLIGDWRDVTPEICATFATAKSEAKRDATYQDYQRLSGSGTPPAAVYTQTREQWLAAHPPGCIEYREAMSPSGTYGRWLRGKAIAAQVGDTLFMHAGINPERPAPKSIASVIDITRDEIRRLDAHRQRLTRRRLALPTFTLQQVLEVSVAELRHATAALEAAKAEGSAPPALDVQILREAQELLEIGKWNIVDPEGPLWFRGYAQWDETSTSPRVFAFLDGLKIGRIVVGHTVTTARKITPRYDGRVVLIDTGMLTSVYAGTPAALEIRTAMLKAIYPTEEVVLTAKPATVGPGSRSH
jgi:hypothetical protein